MVNQLCSANVVGRDELIASVWRLLQHRSLRFTADSPQRWTVVLDQVLSELCQHAPHRKLLLLLDELPYMLQRFAADGCPGDALLLLDCLRAARQKYAGLRMIFAGSIGLHHVLHELRQQTLASEPVNDMPAVEIRGLEPAAGCLLARQLLTADSDPWEMEHFRSRLPVYYRSAVSDANGRQIPDCLIASEILDHFALTDRPLSIDQVWTAMRSRFALTD
ncbi:MAG: hypothetical protein ACK5FF_08535, partial [Planctomyces sp.]